MPTFIQNAMFSKRRDLKIVDAIFFDEAETLVKTNKCCLYNLTITVNGRLSYKALNYLLDNAKANTEIWYSKVKWYVDRNSIHEFNKSMNKMKALNYDLSVVAINESFHRLNLNKIGLTYNPFWKSTNMMNISQEINILYIKWKLNKNPFNLKLFLNQGRCWEFGTHSPLKLIFFSF